MSEKLAIDQDSDSKIGVITKRNSSYSCWFASIEVCLLRFDIAAGDERSFGRDWRQIETMRIKIDTKSQHRFWKAGLIVILSTMLITACGGGGGGSSAKDTATITLADVAGDEDGGPATVTATLDTAVSGGFTVDVSTADDTATLADNDYTAITSHTLVFSGTAGEAQTFTVTPTPDTLIEPDETVTVSMANVSNAVVDITDTAAVTINDDDGFSYSLDVPNIGTVKYTLLAKNGGRVSWYRGTISAHDRVAYDGTTQRWGADSRTDVYAMNADGSNKECITCNMPEFEALYQDILAQRQSAGDTRLGFWIGQPEWHPDGTHAIVQVENLNSPHLTPNFMSFGVDNDLWILNVETKTANRIWTTSAPRNAALHPRFSDDGSKLIFAQRILTNLANVWDGWGVIVADFDISQPPGNMISNANLIAPDGRGFYETTGFIGGSNIDFSYSFTPFENNTVLPYVGEGRITDVNGSFSQSVVDFANAWDEKPRYSPTTLYVVVTSSAFDTAWMPVDGPATAQLDLYLGTPGGIFDRFTFFNDLDRYSTRVLVTDHEWNQTADKLVIQAAPNVIGIDPEIWLVELPQVY